MEKFILTKNFILDAQVCAEATYDEALEWIRKENPAGTQNNWSKNEGENFAPVTCADHPERTHYAFVC